MGQHDDHVVSWAREQIGASQDRFYFVPNGFVLTVAKCVKCGTLFGSKSFNLADVDHVLRGDCGQPKREQRFKGTWHDQAPLPPGMVVQGSIMTAEQMKARYRTIAPSDKPAWPCKGDPT